MERVHQGALREGYKRQRRLDEFLKRPNGPRGNEPLDVPFGNEHPWNQPQYQKTHKPERKGNLQENKGKRRTHLRSQRFEKTEPPIFLRHKQ